jgi:hypothetical protein
MHVSHSPGIWGAYGSFDMLTGHLFKLHKLSFITSGWWDLDHGAGAFMIEKSTFDDCRSDLEGGVVRA